MEQVREGAIYHGEPVMDSINVFEAKADLPRILEHVGKGERLLITSDGQAVAMLVPIEQADRADAVEVAKAMLAYRDQIKRQLGGSFRDLAYERHLSNEPSLCSFSN